MNRYTTFKCINKYVKHIFKSIYLYIRYIEIKMEAVKKLLNECMKELNFLAQQVVDFFTKSLGGM